MENYSEFAVVYDLFMDNIPYESWSVYVIDLLKEYGINDGLILDLGCGTGTMTELLAAEGYDMIGVDCAADMLNVAMQKREQSGHNILYLNQDMREFELYGTVKAVVSICDCLNYITEEEELLTVFQLVNNYLDPGGIFIFDMNTIYKYEQIGDATIAENREEGSFIWENSYYEEEQINEYELTLFLPEADGRFQKYVETHVQRGYTLETIQELLEEAGMEFIAAYDAFTREPVKAESERMYIIAREQGK